MQPKETKTVSKPLHLFRSRDPKEPQTIANNYTNGLDQMVAGSGQAQIILDNPVVFVVAVKGGSQLSQIIRNPMGL